MAGTLEVLKGFLNVRCGRRGSEKRRRKSAAESDSGCLSLVLLSGIPLDQSWSLGILLRHLYS